MTDESPLPNMKKIAPGIYLVRSEAGFRKALKEEFADYYKDWPWTSSHTLDGYPKSYPSVVALHVGYRGDYVFRCNSVHVNTLLEVLRDA